LVGFTDFTVVKHTKTKQVYKVSVYCPKDRGNRFNSKCLIFTKTDLHSEDTKSGFLCGGVESSTQTQAQDKASVSRVNDSIIPQSRYIEEVQQKFKIDITQGYTQYTLYHYNFGTS